MTLISAVDGFIFFKIPSTVNLIAECQQEDYNLDLEVVKRSQTEGFEVLPWRWIVERTFALVDALSAVDYRL